MFERMKLSRSSKRLKLPDTLTIGSLSKFLEEAIYLVDLFSKCGEVVKAEFYGTIKESLRKGLIIIEAELKATKTRYIVKDSFKDFLMKDPFVASEFNTFFNAVRNPKWNLSEEAEFQLERELHSFLWGLHKKISDASTKKISEVLMDLYSSKAIVQNIDSLIETLVLQMRGRRSFLKGAVVTGAAVTWKLSKIGSAGLAGAYVYLIRQSNKLPKSNPMKDGELAILISEPKNLLDKFGALFVDAYIARIELAFGFRALLVFKNATRTNFATCVEDDNIQHMCVLGHGSYSTWWASDGPVRSSSIHWVSSNTKRGYLLKHTCGIQREESEEYETIRRDKRREFIRETVYLDAEIYSHNAFIHLGRLKKSLPLDDILFDRKQDKSFKKVGRNLSELPEKFLVKLRDLVDRIEKSREQSAKFGFPIFEDKKIAVWERISYPWDFLVNPFNKTDLPLKDCFEKEIKSLFG
ncbi:hypothetical protein ACFLZN_00905 [Nanoarchaeota archaeon]